MTTDALNRIAAELMALGDDDSTPACLRAAADGLRLAARRLDAQAEMIEVEDTE